METNNNPNKSSLDKKFNQSIIDRATNLALYGAEDTEILETLRPEIDEVLVTTRWVLFLARMARSQG